MNNTSNSTVLYRKYRPQAWNDVIGQEHIVGVLEGSIRLGRLSHAYLFSGTRGTGKTTVARIFARAIGVTDNDVYEIDAASNNGVDEMRLINEAVTTRPFESPYKIYIFDEVHMFSKAAFNALLKTLEEPPSHVIFILATTETDKIPETVLSRCQVFTFKKPTREILAQHVVQVAKKEGYVLETGASDLIALLGDGSFRDTLGILQKVVSSSEDKKVSIAEVEKITGAPKGSLVNDFVSALASREKEKALTVLMRVVEGNIAMKTFTSLVLEKIRIILLLKNAPSMEKDLKDSVSQDDWKILETMNKDSTSNLSPKTLLALLTAYDAIGRSYIESLPLELATIEICG